MTTDQTTDAAGASTAASFGDEMRRYWLAEADANRALGFHDLAATCDLNASAWPLPEDGS